MVKPVVCRGVTSDVAGGCVFPRFGYGTLPVAEGQGSRALGRAALGAQPV